MTRTSAWGICLALSAGLCAMLAGCGDPWNNPYPVADSGKNTMYAAFAERPKHLDPVQSYSENEAVFNAQIYEPPLQYHYLRRPYTLIPQTVAALPRPRYFDASDRQLADEVDAREVAYSLYELKLRPGIRYQPHPAFARDAAGKPVYSEMSSQFMANARSLQDFPQTDTRELLADDYVYQIKRLAHPRLHSPIFGLMSEYVIGLRELSEALKAEQKRLTKAGTPNAWIDLRKFPMSGASVVDATTYRIKVKGKYPQFAYWLAMSFFAPMPYEAERFFAQPGMAEKNLSLDWYPIGTGPYMLTKNDPNRQMVLERNPNYHGETYPAEGEAADRAAGLLNDAGKAVPFIDRVVFTREKESIPYWNKFLQGYFDKSGINSDNFDQAVSMGAQGEAQLSEPMLRQGIRLETSVATSISYLAFNMLDPVVGGLDDAHRKLRRALSMAVDYEELISIFANGRGIAAQGPIPPGIFGYRDGKDGINPLLYAWQNGQPQRRSLDEARKLLVEAGYPDGRDAKTGKPLVLYLDATGRSGADDKARFDWWRKQFAKLNIQLEIRPTDYNRFQDKVRKGTAQLFTWGWNADYPDPENFMFLFLTAQSKVKSDGENAANYSNPEFDNLFEQMKNMDNSPERQRIIDRMTDILRQDAPWMFGLHPKDYGLLHSWLVNVKPNHMARNGLKYERVDAALRTRQREAWNRPVVWPIGITILVLIGLSLPAVLTYRRRERMAARPA